MILYFKHLGYVFLLFYVIVILDRAQHLSIFVGATLIIQNVQAHVYALIQGEADTEAEEAKVMRSIILLNFW